MEERINYGSHEVNEAIVNLQREPCEYAGIKGYGHSCDECTGRITDCLTKKLIDRSLKKVSDLSKNSDDAGLARVVKKVARRIREHLEITEELRRED